MNWVDVALGGVLLIVALAGWRTGLIATAAAFFGFVAGAAFGVWLVPRITAGQEFPAVVNTALLFVGLIIGGLLGQALLGALGRGLRSALDFAPVRVLDSLAGLLVSSGVFLFFAWLVLSMVATLPATQPVEQVRDSRGYEALEGVMAGPGSSLLSQLRGLLAQLDLPRIPFNEALLPPVAAPDDDTIPAAARSVASASVLPVSALAGRCDSSSTGSSVVVGAQRVVTNAHVVGGATRITVRYRGATLPARLVYLDRAVDVAVLYVPGLRAPAPDWAATTRGTDTAVVGYPLGGPLKLRPARVRGNATIANNVGAGQRQVLVFRGRVQPGNSGGALLNSAGKAVGLVFASAADDEYTGFALPASTVTPVIRKTASATQAVGSGTCAK